MARELRSSVDFFASGLREPLNSPDALRELYRNHKTILYCDVSAFWLMLYDYCISFGRERNVIWTSRWNTSKVLYLLTRYTVFVASALQLPFFRSSAMAFAGAIFTLRTVAVFNGSKRFNCIIFALYGFFFATGIASMVIFAKANAQLLRLKLQTRTDGSLGLPNEWPGCMLLARATHQLLVGFTLVLAFETIVCIMMLWHGFMNDTGSIARLRLIRIIYQDAVVFYVAILSAYVLSRKLTKLTLPQKNPVVSIANVVTLAIPGPFTYAITQILILVLSLQLVLHSVLACRVILHIREEAQPSENIGEGTSFVLAEIQTFTSFVHHPSLAATRSRDMIIGEGD
ncbi:hypothetical protein DL96DRAFT_1561638 [Flagelloscypha sp. PMI_526]|nr:hypothetical protein DL96DRAFT_1561638 [Flagelloscypha sp. PMI_526]